MFAVWPGIWMVAGLLSKDFGSQPYVYCGMCYENNSNFRESGWLAWHHSAGAS